MAYGFNDDKSKTEVLNASIDHYIGEKISIPEEIPSETPNYVLIDYTIPQSGYLHVYPRANGYSLPGTDLSYWTLKLGSIPIQYLLCSTNSGISNPDWTTHSLFVFVMKGMTFKGRMVWTGSGVGNKTNIILADFYPLEEV